MLDYSVKTQYAKLMSNNEKFVRRPKKNKSSASAIRTVY